MKNYVVNKSDMPGYLFESIQQYVQELINKFESKSVMLTDSEFKKKNYDLYAKIAEFYKKAANPMFQFQDEIYLTLRITSGIDNKYNNLLHFDTHYSTIVHPIIFKNFSESKNGDLLISKKMRNSDGYLINVIKKFFMQNIFYRKYIKKNINEKFDVVKLSVGEQVSFCGYRTFHGNDNIEEGKIRASLIIHSQEMFKDSFLFKLIKFFRHYRYKLT
tara:strand:+ start:6124 stop:6774 length:651 start_codon:yes stop_codon:yes gene_type:complete